jgi:SAM-dependent methyltransferase
MTLKNKRIHRLMQLGFIGIANCFLGKIYLRLLSMVFKFDRWHTSAPYSCRPYKSEVVNAANNINPSSVLEVGCGLGEIVSKINSKKCFGIDRDAHVINAAIFLCRKKKIKFFVANLSDVQIISNNIGQNIDLLVLVNWPHGCPWSQLYDAVRNLINTLGVSSILIDGINPDVSGYSNYYGAKDFEQWGKIVNVTPLSDNVRSLYHIEIN